jgi:osmoprotectant transport system substrate-binding protein
MMRTFTALSALVAIGGVTASACAASGSSSKPDSPPVAVIRSAATSLPSRPGSVTIGSADFPESELLAYTYAGAMRARGVKVSIRANIGERPAYIAALRDGSIGAVPEYSGALLDGLDTSATAITPEAVDAHLQQVAATQGLTVTNYAQAQDVDTVTVTKATAVKYHLSNIGDLKQIAGKLSLGAPAPLLTVPYGVPALKRAYGVVFQRFVPLPATGTVTQLALQNGTVQAADIFSTDPSITRDRFVSLKDPKRIFLAENVLAVFKQSVLTKPMLEACNAVSAHLHTATLRELDGRVAAGEDPTAVAAAWLKSVGIAE